MRYIILLLLMSFNVFAQETGPVNSIMRVPAAGGKARMGSIDLSASGAVGSSVLGFTNGGTNKNMTAAAGGVVWTDSDSMEVSAAGTAGQCLISNGTSAPAFGVLGISGGGTNNSGAYTAGSILFSSGTAITQDNASLFWDDSNNFLGLGTAAPSQKLDVSGKIALDGTVIAYRPTTMTSSMIFGNGGTNLLHTSGNDGWYNTFVGIGAGVANTTGSLNTLVGYNSGVAVTTGSNNTFLGYLSGATLSTGSNNVAVGYLALNAANGAQNTAVGYRAAVATTGQSNTAIGFQAINGSGSGGSNSAVGSASMQNVTTGGFNTSLGANALLSNTTGINNTALGSSALRDVLITDGSGNNTAIGFDAGRGITTGINNTIIGANVTGLSATLSNNIILADGSGNRRINVDSTGQVGIGVTAPAAKLEVNGSALFDSTVNVALETDATTTGAAQTIGTTKFIKRMTNASLTSIAGITAPTLNSLIILVNLVGADVTVQNDITATAADRILTGTGANLTWASGSSLWLAYDLTSARWRIIGGTGGSGGSTTIYGSTGSPRSIVAATGIVAASSHMSTTLTPQIVFAVSSVAGASTAVSANPQIQAHTVIGAKMDIIGTSDTDVFTLSTGNGLWLNGDWASTNHNVLSLIWDGTVWVESGRN